MYLFVRRSNVNISSNASPTRSSSILASTFFLVSKAQAFNSSSTASHTFGFVTKPEKYLFDIAIVRDTKLPKMFAKSELILSITRSQVIVPSCAKGISCKQ